MKRVLCLGSYQGADSAAWLIGDRLEAVLAADPARYSEIEVRRCASPAELTGLLTGTEAILILDATRDLAAGAVERVALSEIAAGDRWSSHGLDLGLILETVRALNELPGRLSILALGVGDAQSLATASAAACLSAVVAELESL